MTNSVSPLKLGILDFHLTQLNQCQFAAFSGAGTQQAGHNVAAVPYQGHALCGGAMPCTGKRSLEGAMRETDRAPERAQEARGGYRDWCWHSRSCFRLPCSPSLPLHRMVAGPAQLGLFPTSTPPLCPPSRASSSKKRLDQPNPESHGLEETRKSHHVPQHGRILWALC